MPPVRLPRSLLTLLIFALWGTSCAQRASDAALKVVVYPEQNLKATCVKVAAERPGQAPALSKGIEVIDEKPLFFAVYRGDDLEETVNLHAIAFVGPKGCDEPLKINVEGPPKSGTFRPGDVPPATLLQLPYPAEADDFDRDGYSKGPNGPDCDDSQTGINPGVAEICGDNVDNNCLSGTDCAERSCWGQTCATGICTPAGACQSPKVESACDDGLDNDQDGVIDCADPDCGAKSCLIDACNAGTCAGNVCGSPRPRVCNSPPNTECFNAAGTCSPGQGCTYTPKTGQACSNGGVCNVSGVCAPLLGYTPSNFAPPPLADFDAAMDVDCDLTFDSSGALAACPGQTAPQLRVVSMSDNSQAVLVAVKGLTVRQNRTLRLIGNRPIIFAVFGDVRIEGTISAASTAAFQGAGSGAALSCMTGVGAGVATGGGGAGGSYGGAGGAGGRSFDNLQGGPASPAAGNATIVPLRAGCLGGAGGGAFGGPGGRAGGGVQISASGSIQLVNLGGLGGTGGIIDAGAAGGGGGQANSAGGGGGGSGGAILLESATLVVQSRGRLTVNGGGGGEGSGDNGVTIVAGNTGEDATASTTPAAGGNGPGNGGGGGAGAAGATAAVPGDNAAAMNAGGGGGGGGSIGRIRLNVTQTCTLAAQSTVSGTFSSEKCVKP